MKQTFFELEGANILRKYARNEYAYEDGYYFVTNTVRSRDRSIVISMCWEHTYTSEDGDEFWVYKYEN